MSLLFFFYHLAVYGAISLSSLAFTGILLTQEYFHDRKFWRNWFMVGCAITFLASAGNILDGETSHEMAHVWLEILALGVGLVLSGALLMHWKEKFKKDLFLGSMFYDKFFSDEGGQDG